MEYLNKRMLLNKRPIGMPGDDCWILDKKIISSIKKNQIIIKAEYLSIDPYMRGRMNDSMSYATPAKLGEPMTGETIGKIIESKSNIYKVGDIVCVHKGWQSFIVTDDTDISLYKIPKSTIPISYFLGAAGMPGRTAFFGLHKIGKPKKGETIVISAASGAVGSIVGQLAKSIGCYVIGIAGGKHKCDYVKNVLGFDECVDYKEDKFVENLNNNCAHGIDIYFENVGGKVTKAVAPLLNKGARVPVCGFISKYNSEDLFNDSPFSVFKKLNPKPKHRFFVNIEWMDEWDNCTNELVKLLEDKKILYKECVKDGIENAPEALRDVLSGKNFGKQLIRI